MDNLVRLAKVFDNFISVGDSFVRVDDIRAIRRVSFLSKDEGLEEAMAKEGIEGIEIITPYGKYVDKSTSFEEFKKMMDVVRQTIKEIAPQSSKAPMVGSPQQTQRKVVPLQEAKPAVSKGLKRIENVSISISGGAGGASGQLPEVNKEPEGPKVVDRKTIVITSPGGIELGRGHADGNGTIVGSNVSGVINTSGKYQLVFKDYEDKEALINYSVQGGS